MTKKAARAARRRQSPGRSLRILLLLALLLAFFWTQQTWIQTEEIEAGAVPAPFAGLRIAILSDVHGGEFGKDNRRLLQKTAALRPDLIAITGDLIHDEALMPMVEPLARGLTAIAPTYYITGNHEWAARVVPELKNLLRHCGVQVLSNEYVLFEEDGAKLALLGADDNNGFADQKTIPELADEVRDEEGADTYLLLLSHRNNRYPTYVEAKIDLTLSGHAHGGQVRLPFTDGLIGPHREFLPEYTAGHYGLPYGEMVVSRGLGDQFPAFRLFNRPHLPLVILQAE